MRTLKTKEHQQELNKNYQSQTNTKSQSKVNNILNSTSNIEKLSNADS